MVSIIKTADRMLEKQEKQNARVLDIPTPNSTADAIAASAVQIADALEAKLMVCMTNGGTTARLVSKQKPDIPVMCYATSLKVGRQLQAYRGLFPVVTENLAHPSYEEALEEAKRLGWVDSGDTVVFVSADQKTELMSKQLLVRVADVM